jgi:5-oxoprolinase (ATP-hydrolysing) subunit A
MFWYQVRMPTKKESAKVPPPARTDGHHILWTLTRGKEVFSMPLNQIDLNSDVGESFGAYTLGLDAELIPHISSANIACGYHAGDPAVMRRTVALAKANGVALGAHPGLPDLVGFGRRNMDVTIEEIKDFVTVQIGALQAVAAVQGARLQHVKSHGALYNMAVKNPAIWEAVAEVMAALDPRLILFVLAGSDRKELEDIGRRHGIRVAFEFFADRAYNTDGSLVSRKLPGAVIHDNDVVAAKVLKLVKEGKVKTLAGPEIELKAETICVHGDNPKALALVQKIRETLKTAGVAVRPPADFL